MEAADVADQIKELVEEREEDRAEERSRERLRDLAAIVIAILAAILAVRSLGGGNATDDMVANNIKASDAWNFYQAKNQRQTAYELAADAARARLAEPNLSAADRQLTTAQLAKYEATVARYESEPDPAHPNDPTMGEGKKQLKARAQSLQAAFDIASDRDSNFDDAEVVLQLALVLGSVSILARSRAMLIGAIVVGVVGTLLTINGYALLVALPF